MLDLRIRRRPVDRPPIRLRDQFGERRTQVLWPVYFALPARKFRRGDDPIINEVSHPTIYQVEPSSSTNKPIEIDTKDQFLETDVPIALKR